MANYEEKSVLNSFRRIHDINISGKNILELKRFPGEGGTPSKGDVGKKTRAKIHYLTKHCGYTHLYVDGFKNN